MIRGYLVSLIYQNMLKNFCDRHELNRCDVKQVCCITLVCCTHILFCEVFRLLHFFKPLVYELALMWEMWFVLMFQVICAVCDTEQPVCERCLAVFIFYYLFSFLILIVFDILSDFNCIPGCSSLHELWRKYGGIFLRNMQILWWCCNLPSEIDHFSVLVYWILILYCQNIPFFISCCYEFWWTVIV